MPLLGGSLARTREVLPGRARRPPLMRRAPPRRVSPHRTLSGCVVCLFVFVRVFVCVLSTVGASYVGCPIRVCAVSAPLRRVNIHLSVLPSLGLGRHRARVQAECSVGALNADSPASNPLADTTDAPRHGWLYTHSLRTLPTLSRTLALVCGRAATVTSLL